MILEVLAERAVDLDDEGGGLRAQPRLEHADQPRNGGAHVGQLFRRLSPPVVLQVAIQ